MKKILLALLFLQILAKDAFSDVAPVQWSSGFSHTTMLLNGVTTGNFLIMSMAAQGALGVAPEISGITDNMGNTYVQVSNAFSVQGGNETSDLWYAANVTGGDLTLTITYGTPGGTTIHYLAELSGAALVSPTYGGNNRAADSGVAGPDLTTTSEHDLLISAFNPGSSGALEAPWGTFTPLVLGIPTGYYLPGSIGTFHASCQGGGFSSSGVVVKAAGGTPPAATAMFQVFD